MSKTNILKRLEKKWETFNKQVNHLVCSRCRRKGMKKIHHGGRLNDLLKLDRNHKVLEWSHEIEHGYFHGYMTSFLMFLLSDGKLLPIDLASSIFHDIARFTHGDEDHDRNLELLTTSLLPETYTHSKPPASDEAKMLIQADRWELNRFKASKIWLNPSSFEEITGELKFEIELFYSTVRPALENLIHHRDELWIRHGPDYVWEKKGPLPKITMEIFQSLLTNNFYPHKFWRNNDKLGFAIEPDRVPFNKCFNHGLSHDVWKNVWGIAPLSLVEKFGGEFNSSKGRDHLFLSVLLPTNKWTFIIKNMYNEYSESLLQTDFNIATYKMIQDFWGPYNILFDRICMLNPQLV